MAKMFYSLEETAAKLGKTTDEVEAMVEAGTLQQFRDGDNLMFKVIEVDELAGDAGGDALPLEFADDSSAGSSGFGSGFGSEGVNIFEDDDLGDGPDDSNAPTRVVGMDLTDVPAGETGSQNVFDLDENVEEADPSAQTKISEIGGMDADDDDEEELVLEAVGSGSGLLDLTRESDDTSLGAELLEEIYPAGATGADVSGANATGFGTGNGTGMGYDTANASASMTPSWLAGIFDDQSGGETGAASMFDPAQESMAAQSMTYEEGEMQVQVVPYQPDVLKLSSALMISGFLVPALVLLVIALLVVGNLVVQWPGATAATDIEKLDMANTWVEHMPVFLGVTGGCSFVFGLVGYFVGRSMSR